MSVSEQSHLSHIGGDQVLRVAVVGAGRMGSDHVQRLSQHILRAEVSAVVDVDVDRAAAVAAQAPGAEVFSSFDELMARGALDAVLLATPGFLHEEPLLKLIDAGIPVLCEKPLTPDPASALRVVQAEVTAGRRLIHVGFMRRYDSGYLRLKQLIQDATYGRLLMLHHQHRNYDAPEWFTTEMLIEDSVVHEFDAVRFFTGEEIANVEVRSGRSTTLGSSAVREPQLVTVQTESGLLASVEIFVNSRVGYQVHTQAVFERGVVKIGEGSDVVVSSDLQTGSAEEPSFITRFGQAYDVEVQNWVDSVHRGVAEGPSAWDGYATAAVCGAGIEAQGGDGIVPVSLGERPALYTAE